MKSLKIALFTYSTKPRGGVVHSLRLAEELELLGHKVHIFTISTGNGFYRNVGIPHTLIPCSINYENIDEKVSGYIKIYSDYLASNNMDFDIYHAEDCISANALLESRGLGLIDFFVRTVHHLDDFISDSLISCQLKSILEPDYLISVSDYWNRELDSQFSLNSVVINNGVDVEKFNSRRVEGLKQNAKKRFSVDGCIVMLSIGGIEPRKNTLTTLKAFDIASSYFRSKGKRLVWLIGGGETLFDYRAYRDQFFSEAKSLGLTIGKDIIILNSVPEGFMVDLYRAGDVFIFPSIKEGWGLVVLEAMAAGLPVISSNIEPMTEYLVNGSNSILISPMDYKNLAEQAIRVLEEPELRHKLGIKARETAKLYSWKNTALKHLEFYKGILS